jgi:hypothetical protein
MPEVDAFLVTDEYREIADMLGLTEWHPAVWIGRLFILDNDLGEHWFDNWDLRDERGLSHDYMIIAPSRFQDGRDGPCHTDEFRKRFWTDVLRSLELSFDLLFDEARQFNAEKQRLLNEYPGYEDAGDAFIPDLEDRILKIRAKFQQA